MPPATNDRVKIIHCNTWGDIEVTPRARRLIDSWAFQRLHYIKQNGLAYKVFPTATATRFAHSLGVYHLTRLLLQEIRRRQPDVYEKDAAVWDMIPLAGLCHDIGHGPFSHLFDRICTDLARVAPAGCTHEERGLRILREFHLLDETAYTVMKQMLRGPKTCWYHFLVHNPVSSFDLDKIDYLQRDVLQFGIRNGGVDISRIFLHCHVMDNELVFAEQIRIEMEALFQLRDRMYRDIYLHPAIQRMDDQLLAYLSSEHPFLCVIQQVLAETSSVDVFQQFLTWTDETFLSIVLPGAKERIMWETRQWTIPKSVFGKFRSDEQFQKAIDHLKYAPRQSLYRDD